MSNLFLKINEMFSFRYHGNYAGPGWSAGKYQKSVARSSVPAIDEFDETAKEHDAAYALGKDLKQADYKFYKQNIGKGIKRTAAALAVGLQGMLRSGKRARTDSFSQNENIMARTRSRTSRPRTRLRLPSMLNTPRTGSQASRGRSRSRSTMSISPVRRRTQSVGGVARSRTVATQYNAPVVKGTPAESKSSGFFPKGTGKYNRLDFFAKNGVSACIENGDKIEGTAANPYQAVMIGHSTVTVDIITQVLGMALAKFIAAKLGMDLLTFDTVIRGAATHRAFYWNILWKGSPLNAAYDALPYTYTPVATSSTWNDFVGSFQAWFVATACQYPNMQVCELQIWRDAVGTTPVVGYEQIGKYDLSRAKFYYYAKSALKVQNRTITSTNDDEAVDNVPLYGKTYEGSGNYFQHLHTTFATAKSVAKAGCKAEGFQNPAAFCEPQNKKQLKHVKKVGKAHLDPGNIRTSVLQYAQRFNLGALAKAIAIYAISDAGHVVNIGNYRFVHLEKMIQSESTTDVKAIKCHYEVDLKVGGMFTCPKTSVTPMTVTLSPL